ncbi:MAG TPA: hypothetical protein VGB89_05585, partial [Bacteroidota bacterium]
KKPYIRANESLQNSISGSANRMMKPLQGFETNVRSLPVEGVALAVNIEPPLTPCALIRRAGRWGSS